MALIELENVRKSFRVRRKTGRFRRTSTMVHAVEDLTLTVEAGEMVGYIGPNGAGKSTTIKMLTGILVPSAGLLRVAGADPSRERTRLTRRIGVVFGQRTTLWWDLPLRDSYGLLRRIYKIPERRYRANLERYVDLLDIGDLLDTPVRQLSLGQRMRGDIVAALLHDPDVLYLDEPNTPTGYWDRTPSSYRCEARISRLSGRFGQCGGSRDRGRGAGDRVGVA